MARKAKQKGKAGDAVNYITRSQALKKLQLSLAEDGQGIVVIAPLDGSPAAEAGISSGSEVLEVEGEPCRILGLEATAARLRGASGTSVQLLIQPPDPEAEPRLVLLRLQRVELQRVRTRLLKRGGHLLGLLSG